MDFNLSEDELGVQKLARDFNRKEIEPLAAGIDRDGRLPDDLIKKFAKSGLLGMTIPKKYGGSGAGNTMVLGGVLSVIFVALVWRFLPGIRRYRYEG